MTKCGTCSGTGVKIPVLTAEEMIAILQNPKKFIGRFPCPECREDGTEELELLKSLFRG